MLMRFIWSNASRGMTSGQLTLEKLRVPLEKERQQLRQARDAILEQLKVLKVSRRRQKFTCTPIPLRLYLWPNRRSPPG